MNRIVFVAGLVLFAAFLVLLFLGCHDDNDRNAKTCRQPNDPVCQDIWRAVPCEDLPPCPEPVCVEGRGDPHDCK